MGGSDIIVDDLKRISFLVANHPIQDTPRDSRKYGLLAEFYSESGQVIHSIDSVTSGELSGVKHILNCRDMTKKSSYDEMLILNLPSIPSEVHSIILYTYSARTVPGDFSYANYALMDYSTSQKLDSRRIKSDEFQADDNGNLLPLYLSYRIYIGIFGLTDLYKTSTAFKYLCFMNINIIIRLIKLLTIAPFAIQIQVEN